MRKIKIASSEEIKRLNKTTRNETTDLFIVIDKIPVSKNKRAYEVIYINKKKVNFMNGDLLLCNQVTDRKSPRVNVALGQ